jgi:hypothetical protein
MKYNRARNPATGRLEVLLGLTRRRFYEAQLLCPGFVLPPGYTV